MPFLSQSILYIIAAYTKKKLCFDSFLALLKEKINKQREIAIANNKIIQFNKAYGNIL